MSFNLYGSLYFSTALNADKGVLSKLLRSQTYKRFEDDFDKKYHSHYINFNEDNLNKVVTQFNQKQQAITAEISKTIDWETYYKGLNHKQKNDFLNDIVRQLFEDSDFLLDNELLFLSIEPLYGHNQYIFSKYYHPI